MNSAASVVASAFNSSNGFASKDVSDSLEDSFMCLFLTNLGRDLREDLFIRPDS